MLSRSVSSLGLRNVLLLPCFCKQTCCHAARSAVRRWSPARRPAPTAGGRTARCSPFHPKRPWHRDFVMACGSSRTHSADNCARHTRAPVLACSSMRSTRCCCGDVPPAWSVAAPELLCCMAVGGEAELQALAEAGEGRHQQNCFAAFCDKGLLRAAARAATAWLPSQHKPSTANSRRRRTSTARLRKPAAWTPHTRRGRRISEAIHPGPPNIRETARRRERTLHALALMQLLPPQDNGNGSETDAAATLSDPSLRPVVRPKQNISKHSGATMAPTAPGEATPGFTPPRSPQPGQDARRAGRTPSPCRAAIVAYQRRRSRPTIRRRTEKVREKKVRPPSSMPGERNS